MSRNRLAIPITLFRRNHHLEYARAQRRVGTPSEHALWALLKHRDLMGFRTKRQPVVGQHVPDFVVPSVRLVVEVDGSAHHGKELRDARRTADLEMLGYSVMRVTARDVMRSPVAVALSIAEEVRRLGRGA